MTTPRPPPFRRLAPRPLDCGACGMNVEAGDIACGRCGEARPNNGWRSHGGVQVIAHPVLGDRALGDLAAEPSRPPRPVEERGRAEGRGRIEEPRRTSARSRAADERSPPTPERSRTDERRGPAEGEEARPAPLRLRVRPTGDEPVLDEFDFAADLVEMHAASRPDPEVLPVELVPGRVYGGRYRVEEVLAKAPGADRYLAVQEPLVRRVLLTVLRADRPTDTLQPLESRFLREAGVLSRMRHPSLAPVHEAGRAPDGTCFATEELLYGFTLADLLDRGPLGPDRLVAIAADIASALATMHEAGVAHRCLRMDQVVVGPRVWRGGAGAEVAQVGRYGLEITPEDIAANEDLEAALAWPPEVHAGQEPDESADIYAVGVILYRVLTGRPTYPGPVAAVVAARAKGDPQALLRDGTAGTTDRLRDVTERCLKASPEARYPSARALLAELEEIAHAPKVAMAAPAPVPVPSQGLPLRGTLVAALAGAFVPTLAVFLLLYRTAVPLAPPPAAPVAAVAPIPAAPVALPSPAVPSPAAAPPAVDVAAGVSAAVAEPVPASADLPPDAEPAPTVTPTFARPASRARRSGYRVPASVASIESATPVGAAPTEAPPVDAAPVKAPVATAAAVEAAPVAAPPPASSQVPGASALTGLWLGKVPGGTFALDLTVAPDGRVTGRARRSDGASEGVVAGRVSRADDGSLRVELQVTEGALTTSYSGAVEGGELRGRIYAGGKAQGRFTAAR